MTQRKLGLFTQKYLFSTNGDAAIILEVDVQCSFLVFFLLGISFKTFSWCLSIAIICRFLTKRGKTICSNPDSPWAQNIIKNMNRDKQTQEGSTASITTLRGATSVATTLRNVKRSNARSKRKVLAKMAMRARWRQKKRSWRIMLTVILLYCNSNNSTHTGKK